MQKEIAQYYDPLLNFIRKRVSNQMDAEDLTQDVFYKLAKSEKKDVKNIKSWVHAIARNSVTDYYRSGKTLPEEIENLQLADEEMDEESGIDLAACVTPFIEKLPEKYRQLIKMSEIDGLSQKEIAASLDMNYVTVRSQIQRGRIKLRALISECCQVLQGGRGSIIDVKKKKGDCDSNC